MTIPSECLEHVGVLFCTGEKFHVFPLTFLVCHTLDEAPESLFRHFSALDVLCMLDCSEDKHFLNGGEIIVYHSLGERKGKPIGIKHFCVSTKHVSGELIEENEERHLPCTSSVPSCSE